MGREIVGADASVLIVLAKAGRLSLLSDVFEKFLVETAVERECLQGLPERSDARAIEAALHEGRLKRAKARIADVGGIAKRHPNLGKGEAGAIALGRGGIALLDDGLARRAARLEGAMPVGTLGILARAYRMGAVKEKHELAAILRDVLSAGLWVDASVIESFWGHARAGTR